MSEIKVNKISPRTNCGTTTLGDSGDTFTIPAGVTITNNGTQTGFGRTGAVDWQTTIKTGDFTAVSGEGYFINTTSGTITMTLPASPSVGDIVAFKDYAGTFDTNNLTINRNGSNIIGGTNNPVISAEGQAGTLVYGDATQGWQIVEAATDSDLPRPSFITATGGTITTVDTNFKVHTFTGPGTFTVCSVGNAAGSNTVDYLVIAGGGAGGSAAVSEGGGGGGAGGYRESSGAASGCYSRSPLGACVSALPVSATSYPITIGAGGTAKSAGGGPGNDGNNSIFSTITSAAGGGAGGQTPSPGSRSGGDGGSGGGATNNASGGSGNTPSVSPPQGNNGGPAAPIPSNTPVQYFGGGGGGATSAGISGSVGVANGGAGGTSSINGTPTGRGGGGGGGANSSPNSPLIGSGTSGGGNAGSINGTGSCATANTGGGGGGGSGPSAQAGGNGGSGIVIIRYKFQ